MDLGADANLPEEDRCDGSGNTGADDQRLARAVGHVLLLALVWCYERSLANYLTS